MIELEQVAQKNELILIEDACEGFGGQFASRPIGSFGRAAVFGFYPNKQITTGEGGMIVTDDDTFAAVCRSLRNQGRDGMNWLAHARLGYNYRLSEINAALGIAQMSRLDEILENRRRVAHHYMERLMTNRYLILPTLQDDTHMSWFVFVVRLNDLFEPGRPRPDHPRPAVRRDRLQQLFPADPSAAVHAAVAEYPGGRHAILRIRRGANAGIAIFHGDEAKSG